MTQKENDFKSAVLNNKKAFEQMKQMTVHAVALGESGLDKM